MTDNPIKISREGVLLKLAVNSRQPGQYRCYWWWRELPSGISKEDMEVGVGYSWCQKACEIYYEQGQIKRGQGFMFSKTMFPKTELDIDTEMIGSDRGAIYYFRYVDFETGETWYDQYQTDPQYTNI